jgi:hypothetical protein
MKTFILTVILLALSVAGFGVRIWIKGAFTENETGNNKNMKNLGINCVKNEEMERHNSKKNKTCMNCSFHSSCSKKV